MTVPRRCRAASAKKAVPDGETASFQERDTGGNSKKPFLYSISGEAAERAAKSRCGLSPAHLPLFAVMGTQEAWSFLFSYISISALRKSSLTEDASEG